jgi:hypothetical protein
MRHWLPTRVLKLLVLPFMLGCQPTGEAPKTSDRPVAGSNAGATSKTMKLGVTTDFHDANGKHLDQKLDIVDATPEVVTSRFKVLDWNHPTTQYGIALSRGELNAPDWKKLSIYEESVDGTQQTVWKAKLQETPPGETSDKVYLFEPLESPDVALKLLLSFLAEDGEYRTTVQWQEQRPTGS